MYRPSRSSSSSPIPSSPDFSHRLPNGDPPDYPSHSDDDDD